MPSKKMLLFLTCMGILMLSCNKENLIPANLFQEDVHIESTLHETSFQDISQLKATLSNALNRKMANSKPGNATQLLKNGNGAVSSNENVTSISDPQEVVGHCTVTRTKKGAHINWHSKGLPPGDAVTLWIIIASANETCDAFEFLDLIYGGGTVVTPSGNYNLTTFLANNDTSNSVLLEVFGIPGQGMSDSFERVIHLIVRTHGQHIPGSDQLTTFNGSCNTVCEDLQESVHIHCL